VVTDNILGYIEPEIGQGVEDLALERDKSDDAVESTESVGGNEDSSVIFGVVVANFAFVAFAEVREIRAGQTVLYLIGDLVVCEHVGVG